MAREDADLKVVGEMAAENLSAKPVIRRYSWSDMRRPDKKDPEKNGILIVAPEEIGEDRDELGMNPGDTVGIVFRPFKANEEAEIRETVKDVPENLWLGEYNDEICLRCIVEPEIPNNAEGRRFLQRWMPGLRATIATAVQTRSGMGRHVIKEAREELGKLVPVTPRTSKTSSSLRNTA